MKKDELASISRSLAERLQAINYNELPISEYNKQYIARLHPALPYYMEIYADCLLKGIRAVNRKPEEIVMVDFGGGSGFLSMLAKEAGIGRVIYIDLNPLSVETAKILKEEVDVGPDTILPGSSAALADWCAACRIKPHLLIATDLIEHIYNLPDFFTDLYKVNDRMQMLFTTASTPYNPFVKRRLHKLMKGCETGSIVTPNYYAKREQFIREQYPAFSDEQVVVWATLTRGLVFDDIRKAINESRLPVLTDKYNTCDPETGNWTERILPISRYRMITKPFGYKLLVGKGYYNSRRNNPAASFITKCINALIRLSGPFGLLAAPFIFLLFTAEED